MFVIEGGDEALVLVGCFNLVEFEVATEGGIFVGVEGVLEDIGLGVSGVLGGVYKAFPRGSLDGILCALDTF